MGAVAVGATNLLWFRRERPPNRGDCQSLEMAHVTGHGHRVVVLHVRNNAFKKDKDYHVSADLTGQANHIGVTIQADIIRQKLPENNGVLYRRADGRQQLR